VSAVDVAVSIVRADDGRVLLGERTERQIAAGYWELPGGKIDPGESAQQAAARELFEEIGILGRTFVPSLTYEHAFKTKTVRLHFFRVEGWTGTPHGREGQRLAWVDPATPSVAPILPSNERILASLALPARAAFAGDGGEALASLSARAAAGLRLILVCDQSRAPDQRIAFARRLVERVRPYGTMVLLGGSALEARRAGADGVSSSPIELRRSRQRPSVRLWSAACEDAADLALAVALGADAAVLTGGFPDASRVAAATPIPIYLRDSEADAVRIDGASR
jgi:8-oxo-dGTP diphosphatase